MSSIWSYAELESFRQNEYLGERAIYADNIMRPMAKTLLPEFLKNYDNENNSGKNKLGPNWHAFAGDLEREIIQAHKVNDNAKLQNCYAFINWALFEPTSYLGKEAYITPMEGIATELDADQWMKFFPLRVFDKLLPHMDFYFQPHVASNMRKERQQLLRDTVTHESYWKPLHRKFVSVAKANKVPFSDAL